MGNKTVFFILVLAWSSLQAQSPITLGNTNMPGNNDTLRYTNVLVTSVNNYTQTGTNHSWNFTNVTSLNEGVRSFKSALLTPYAFFFLGLNEYGEKISDSVLIGPVLLTNYYNFYRKQNSPAAFVADGVGLTYQNAPIPSYYSDKDELYMFPMTYPKYDSTTFRYSVSPPLLPMKYVRSGYRVTKVDGWGTVTTPYGPASCLRLVTTQYGIDSLKLSLLSFGIPSVQRSYQWLTATSKIPYFEVSGNLLAGNFFPTSARYRGYDKSLLTAMDEHASINAAGLYPNPAKDHLVVSEKKCALSIFNLSGQEVFSGLSDETGRVDISSLAPGAYLLQLKGAEFGTYARFIKE